MTNYRRIKIKGATYFFTVNCENRTDNSFLTRNIALLRQAFKETKKKHPFKIDAIVVLPDHLHCIWTLPDGDSEYAKRWTLIKSFFSRKIPENESISKSRQKRGERGIWQRRYWEHVIRDETDLKSHIDYIHWNPVKHGYVNRVVEWPYSSFHNFVKAGIYQQDWGIAEEMLLSIPE